MRSSRLGSWSVAVAAWCTVIGLAASAQAATKTWTGVIDGQWSVAGNWAGGVPVAADKLSFFAAPGTHITTNDLTAGTIFDDISFLDSPYSLGGNALGLTGGINNSSGSNNTITLPITLHANQAFVGSLSLGGPITLGANTLTLGNGSGFISVSGNISGSGGVNIGTTTVLSGTNTYNGQTLLNAFASLTVNGTQAASPVLITAGVLQGSGTIGSLTTTPAPFANVSPTGTLSTGTVQLGGGTNFFTSLNGPVAGIDYGQLNVAGSVTLAANVQLSLGLGFAPSVGQTFTLINNDGIDPISGTFNGLPEGSLMTLNASQFQLSYVGGTGNDVVLTCTVAAKTWSGAVDSQWSVGGNWGGVAPVAGDPLVFPPGASNLANTNDLTAGTIYAQVLLTGNGYTLGGNAIGLTGGIDNSSGSGNTINLPLTLHANQSFLGSLNLGGPITLGANTLTLGNGSGFISVSGNIGGSGGVNIGTTTVLSGTNTYNGQTLLNAFASLTVNGTQAASPVLITAGILQGSGTIGSLTTTPAPFANISPTGMLSTGTVQLGSGTNVFTSLNGPVAGIDYGQLNVAGSVTLAANVPLQLGLGFAPSVGQTFTLINNDGIDPISGTFNGLPEGSIVTLNASQFQLSYVGGSGNDVVLTCTVAARTWSGAVDTLWSTPGNWESSLLPVAGDPLVFPSGAANLANSNDLPAGTNYSQILLTGNGYTLSGNAIGLTGGIDNSAGSGTTVNLPITLLANQTFGGSLTLGGPIALGPYTLTLGNGSGFMNVPGNISGSGGVTIGSSTVLAGTNTYIGPTLLNSFSALTVNGTQPASPVLITAGNLSGTGTIGTLTTAPPPFANVNPSGIMSSGTVQLGNGTNFFTSLNGPAPGSGYGQLDVGGGVTIVGSVSFSANLGFVPAQGQIFLVIDNDGTDTITGTFNGLPEGSIFNIGPYPFQVSYIGETGNDFTLTSLSGDPLNNAPIAQDDSYNAFSNTPLNEAAPGVLLNDSDPDFDTLTVLTTTVSTTAGGSVTFSPNGSFVYTPPTNYLGADSCQYVVSDGNNGTDIATVNFTVLPAPTPTDTPTPADTPTATPTSTPDPSLCAATPVAGCLTPGKSLFKIKDKSPAGPSAGDKLLWKWLKGPAMLPGDFGSPVTGGTGFRLCVYDTGGLVTQLDVAPGGTCATAPCWKATGAGFKFKDTTLAGDGVQLVNLKAGNAAGKSKIIFKGKDGNLPIPTLALDDSSSVTVQLLRADLPTQCWESVYPGPAIKNTTSQFKDLLP